MAVRIGHASKGESGKVAVKGGVAGDQTGKEVCVRYWYLNSKGWVVLRCKDASKRNKIAEAMEKACKNPQIGYDQYQRDTLFNNVKGNKFDPSRTTKNVETDCSALVRVCIAYAYGEDKVGNIRTVTEPATLVKSGLFDKLTADKYCKSSDYLVRGDILCTPVSGHTVVVLDDGAKVNSASSGSSGATRIDTVSEVQRFLNTTYKSGLKVDNAYGKNTKKAIIKAIQKELGFAADDVDGIWGKKTAGAIKVLKRGSNGALVKLLQCLLVCNGYKNAYVDGDYGTGTENAIEDVQRENNLEVDGEAGKNTFTVLCV